MSTFIDGIGQCQVLDKSAELVDLKGHDISSLAKTGTFNWEHQANTPATLVGKILKAKKIFKKEDCENERELYFWNKAKAPYLYVMGELLDDYTASAKECAGQMRYSKDNPDKMPLLGFSIEGSEIPNTRKGMIITRSIARKVTLTSAPCNSACVCEIYEAPEQKSQIADDFDSIFKNHEEAITLFKSGEGTKIYEDYLAKKETISSPEKTFGKHPQHKGIVIGSTSSGKSVFSHGKVADYGFNSSEHREAANLHMKAAQVTKNAKLGAHHVEKMRLHGGAAKTQEIREGRFKAGKEVKVGAALAHSKKIDKSEKVCELHKATTGIHGGKSGISGHERGVHLPSVADSGKSVMGSHVRHPDKVGVGSKEMAIRHSKVNLKEIKNIKPNLPKSEKNEDELKKALTAGSTNAAPSTLVNGAAYQSESLSSKQSNNGEDHNFHATKKKDWNKRAKQDYENWPHRQKFESFMKSRMPHLAEGEIKAIGKIIALKKSLDFEKSLSKMVGLEKTLKFGSAEDQAKVSAALEERKKNPPKKSEPKSKSPDLKGIVESEVSHVTPYDSSGKYENVHLKSGHELQGHPSGKFKVGDKVVAKPHLMGTHLLEHKK